MRRWLRTDVTSPILLVVGPHGSGKTTLVRNALRETNFVVIDVDLDSTVEQIELLLQRTGQHRTTHVILLDGLDGPATREEDKNAWEWHREVVNVINNFLDAANPATQTRIVCTGVRRLTALCSRGTVIHIPRLHPEQCERLLCDASFGEIDDAARRQLADMRVELKQRVIVAANGDLRQLCYHALFASLCDDNWKSRSSKVVAQDAFQSVRTVLEHRYRPCTEKGTFQLDCSEFAVNLLHHNYLRTKLVDIHAVSEFADAFSDLGPVAADFLFEPSFVEEYLWSAAVVFARSFKCDQSDIEPPPKRETTLTESAFTPDSCLASLSATELFFFLPFGGVQ